MRRSLTSADPPTTALSALLAYHVLRPQQPRRLQPADMRDGRLNLGYRISPLVEPVAKRLAGRLDERCSGWPRTASPEASIHHRTATRACCVGPRWLKLRLGPAAQAAREDHILHEAPATGGDDRLLRDRSSFGVDAASRYAATVDHPAPTNAAVNSNNRSCCAGGSTRSRGKRRLTAVTELISSGRDPDQRRRRPATTLLILIAALITAAGLSAYSGTRHRPAPRPVAAPTPAVTPARAAAARPNPIPPAALRCGLACDTVILHGRVGAGPRGLRLLVNTTPLTVLDAAGRRHPGPRLKLRRGERVATLVPMGAETAALVQADEVTGNTPPGRIYRIAEDGSVLLIGRANALVQGVGGTVWTVTYQMPDPAGTGEVLSYTLREINRAGQLQARYTEPIRLQPVRATRAGMLVTLPKVSDGTYLAARAALWLLDPSTGDLDRQISDNVFSVLDTTDDLVAVSTTEGGPEAVIYDVTRGVQGVYNTPGYHPANYGRFSPDQRALALGFSGLPQLGSNPASYGYLESLDLETGAISQINGVRVPPVNDAELDWTRDSSTLILGVENRNKARVAFWSRQRPALIVLSKVIKYSDNDHFTYLRMNRD